MHCIQCLPFLYEWIILRFVFCQLDGDVGHQERDSPPQNDGEIMMDVHPLVN